ncbi:hypothetical protein A7981_01960 [Methylovorus sp. MM2]|uniref:hypothetical protein n=1 Tax=Methylovorus sp. MM2 TaxID=1848038 RepID=UPI0007E010B7|nr:hypothetical protein [Methylovorus sp. MM2]OAM52276.1 hypothetical protein A7981_01960 [Methylovorus sp. MM2]
MMESIISKLEKLLENLVRKVSQHWIIVTVISVVLIVAILEHTLLRAFVVWLIQSSNYNNGYVVLVTIGTLGLIAIASKLLYEHFGDNTPKWLSYLSDQFHGAEWSWKYGSDYEAIEELQPFCLKCKHDLKVTDGEYPEKIIVCPSCNTQGARFFGSYENYLQTIRNLIKQKIRNNYL